MSPEHAAVLYLTSALEAAGESGWVPDLFDEGHDPARGGIVLMRGDERMVWYLRFNSGDPKWFVSKCPKRFDEADILPPPFPNPKVPE